MRKFAYSSEEYSTSESRDETHTTETLYQSRTRIPHANTQNTLRQDRLRSPCLFHTRHALPRGRRPGSAPRSRTLMTTATSPRACRRPWIRGTRDAVAERLPALLATSGHLVPLSSHRQDLRLLTQWRGTSNMLLLMTTRASSRTLRLAPGVLNSLPTSNGTVSVATPGAAQWLLGATHSDVLSTTGRRKWATLDLGILLGLDPPPHPTPLMPLLRRREVGQAL